MTGDSSAVAAAAVRSPSPGPVAGMIGDRYENVDAESRAGEKEAVPLADVPLTD